MDLYGNFDLEWPASMASTPKPNCENVGESMIMDGFEEDDLLLSTLDLDALFEPEVKVEPVPTQSDSRFKIRSEEELKELEAQRHSKSTLKNTKWALKMFSEWCQSTRNMNVDWKSIPTDDLANLLRSFYAETRPSSKSSQDDEYHRNTMKNIRSALNRHLRILGRHVDIVKDRTFSKANDLLNGKLKANVMAGKSRPTQHKPIIGHGDMKKIRAFLSYKSPSCVQQKAWFDIAVHFVSRGMEFHSQLNLDSFDFLDDDEGREYVVIKHKTVHKTTQGGLDDPESNMHDKRMYATGDVQCPVANLKLLIEKSHPNAQKLFCIIKYNAVVDDPFWYSSKPLSQRQFRMVMHAISKNAGLSRIYTPHCVRATAIQALNDANVELRHIMFMTGHKYEASVRSYSRGCNTDKKHELSNILNQLTSCEHAPNSALDVPRRVPCETVSRPPIEDNLDAAACSDSRNQYLQQSITMSSIAGQAGGIMSRGVFNNCTFTINVNNENKT